MTSSQQPNCKAWTAMSGSFSISCHAQRLYGHLQSFLVGNLISHHLLLCAILYNISVTSRKHLLPLSSFLEHWLTRSTWSSGTQTWNSRTDYYVNAKAWSVTTLENSGWSDFYHEILSPMSITHEKETAPKQSSQKPSMWRLSPATEVQIPIGSSGQAVFKLSQSLWYL